MTSEQSPKPENPTPTNESAPPPQPAEPKTVEAKVVESTSESVKQTATPTSEASSEALDQAKAVAAELWRQAKPVLQKVGTQALILGNQATDFLLDKAFPTAKEKFIQILPADFKAQAQEKIDPVKEKVVPIWQKVWPWLKENVGPLWAKAIAFIRSKLPQDLSGQLSDRFLNVLLITTVYLVWSFFSGLTHPSQAKQPYSDLTFPEVKPDARLTKPEQPKARPTAPSAPEPKAVAPTPKPAPAPKIEPKPTIPPAPKAPVSTVPPAPKPVAPVKTPEPVKPKPEAVAPAPKVATPKPEATKPNTISEPPKPQTPPKQTTEVKPPTPTAPVTKTPVTPVAPVQLVKPINPGPDLASLKADLVESVDRVVEEATAMIGKVSVNDQQLKVELGDRWYKLSEQEQSKLAETLFSKSKKLDYGRLDIRDAQGERVARSPYIGNDMVILKRSTPAPKASSSTPSPSSVQVTTQTSPN